MGVRAAVPGYACLVAPSNDEDAPPDPENVSNSLGDSTRYTLPDDEH